MSSLNKHTHILNTYTPSSKISAFTKGRSEPWERRCSLLFHFFLPKSSQLFQRPRWVNIQTSQRLGILFTWLLFPVAIYLCYWNDVIILEPLNSKSGSMICFPHLFLLHRARKESCCQWVCCKVPNLAGHACVLTQQIWFSYRTTLLHASQLIPYQCSLAGANICPLWELAPGTQRYLPWASVCLW